MNETRVEQWKRSLAANLRGDWSAVGAIEQLIYAILDERRPIADTARIAELEQERNGAMDERDAAQGHYDGLAHDLEKAEAALAELRTLMTNTRNALENVRQNFLLSPDARRDEVDKVIADIDAALLVEGTPPPTTTKGG